MKTITLITFLFLSSVAAAAGPVPTCTPPIAATISIAYQGLTSGCTQAAASPPCLIGENVQFTLADGANVGTCLIVYSWAFPEGTVIGAPPQNHQFQSGGTFVVTLTLASGSSSFTTFTVMQPVSVAAAAVPAMTPLSSVLLALAFGACGMRLVR